MVTNDITRLNSSGVSTQGGTSTTSTTWTSSELTRNGGSESLIINFNFNTICGRSDVIINNVAIEFYAYGEETSSISSAGTLTGGYVDSSGTKRAKITDKTIGKGSSNKTFHSFTLNASSDNFIVASANAAIYITVTNNIRLATNIFHFSDVKLTIEYTYPVNITTSISPEGAGVITTDKDMYYHGDKVTITATPFEHYEFDNWIINGNGDGTKYTQTFYYTAYSDTDFTAIFTPKWYTISTTTNYPAHTSCELSLVSGNWTVNADYTISAEYGTVLKLSGLECDGYKFSHWEDNTTDIERIITVAGDASYVAYYKEFTGYNFYIGNKQVVGVYVGNRPAQAIYIGNIKL